MIKNYIQRDQYAGGGGGGTEDLNPDLNLTTESTLGPPSIDDTLVLPISSKNIDKTFGRKGDYIELHIYNLNNQVIFSEDNFQDFTLTGFSEENSTVGKSILVDPEKILTSRGFNSGQFTVKLNILKNKIFNDSTLPFNITEISDSRREIRSTAPLIANNILDPAVSNFISEIESSVYFKEFSINLGNDILIPCINILLNKTPSVHEILLKTLNPLSPSIDEQLSFKIVEEIVDPIILSVDLGDPVLEDDSIDLLGPNFSIDIKQNQSIPSSFKTYDQLLAYNITSSYQHLLSKLDDDGVEIDVNYDYIRPLSSSIEESYHFENFTHFSSAEERLKNFEYKLKLIENYDAQIKEVEAVGGSTANSLTILNAKNDINTKKENLIRGFDGYEQFLYFTSGSEYTWPKQTTTKPYIVYSVTSSNAKTWLGSGDSYNDNYGGQLLSASLFDKQNPYSLNELIPTHIKDNTDNNLYVSFVNMIGQHFDHIWTYIKHLDQSNNSDHVNGISKDLVYYQLKSLGIETFDQFENADLIEYLLGEGTGSGNYDATNFFSSSGVASETMITASNEGSIPKQDIAKEVWKRLYHNAPYLLKTKGTERGLRALMSCYGVPSTILNVKEYGGSTPVSGPLKDLDTADTYKTFTYEKASLALKGDSGTDGFFIKTEAGSGSATYLDHYNNLEKSIEFRIKPARLESNQHLFSTTSSLAHYNNHLILVPYTGNDISSSGDSTQYGKLRYLIGNDTEVETDNFPIFNGDFWNIFINASKNGSTTNQNTEFGAYQANFNKNIHKYVTSSIIDSPSNPWTFMFGAVNQYAFSHYFIGGITPNANSNYDSVDGLRYSGSLQEVRIYNNELLSDATLKKHALEPFMYAGNSISSSFDNLILRLPLGSNDLQDSSSFHPNIDVNYLGMVDGVSSSISSPQFEEIVETHFLPTPDTIGISTTSEKVRIDEGTVDENMLSPTEKFETSTLDRQPQDFEDLGIFFSPTNEINEDIIYTLGSFRLDDFIGSPLPSEQTSSKYNNLKDISNVYFKKIKSRYNFAAYIKQIQQIDHTLFKLIEQFVPFKANTKTGLVIEPHFLERSKIPRTLPVRNDGQTMVTGSHQTIEVDFTKNYSSGSAFTLTESNVISDNNLTFITSSKTGERIERGTNGTVEIYTDVLDPSQKDPNRENAQFSQAPIKPFTTTKPDNYIAHQSSTILGNALGGRKSNRYYKYKEYKL